MSSQNLLEGDGHAEGDDDDKASSTASLQSFLEGSEETVVDPSIVARSMQRRHGNTKRHIFTIIAIFFVFALGIVLGGGLSSWLRRPTPKYATGPNMVVIMSDDQDVLLDSMSVMPNVKRLIGEEGITYQNHYCTNAWCCPSRVNFFTGRAAHNTNVTSTHPPHGGWTKFGAQGLNDNYLPVWLHNAGIRTYYLGKFLNDFSTENRWTPAAPKGWTNSSMLVDPYTYRYFRSHWTTEDSTELHSYPGVHATDVTGEKAEAYLEDAARHGQQFFLMAGPIAPHTNEHGEPPDIPGKYLGHFHDRKAPRRENFNPDEPSGVSWVSKLDKLDANGIEKCDKMQRHRLGNIAYLDDMVGRLVYKLEALGLLHNTYVIYTTDNGYHLGNHRLKPGKRCPFEEDINIPLLIRGPDVAKGVTLNLTSSHTDMAPTILQMFGIDLRDEFDGAPIPYTESAIAEPNRTTEMVNVEFWSTARSPIGFSREEYWNNTYKALRLASADYSFYYSVWCSGEREFYDMKSDFVQMNNRLGQNPKGEAVSYFGRPENELMHRLDSLLMVSKSCKAEACRNPWKEMFPNGEVSDLRQAMQQRYDAFFLAQPKIAFDACLDGQILAVEGPQDIVPFTRFSSLG